MNDSSGHPIPTVTMDVSGGGQRNYTMWDRHVVRMSTLGLNHPGKQQVKEPPTKVKVTFHQLFDEESST